MTIEELLIDYEKRNPNSKKAWEDSKQIIPGGVSANVKFYSPFPLYMKEGRGAYLTDLDGHRYIDFSLSYGPMILGHGRKEINETIDRYLNNHGSVLYGPPHKGEYELAKLIIKHFPSIEMLRYTNSGTEATLLAIRMAKAFTGKNKIAKFEGHYHGGHNDVLVSVNPKVASAGDEHRPESLPASKGITEQQLSNTIVLPFNDLESCKTIIESEKDDLSCVILEPLQGGTIPAMQDFIEGLREITSKLGIILIFDEVKTGFRVALGGAQELYTITPDLTTLGKIIGGGFPIGLVGGRKDIIEQVDPNMIGFFDKRKNVNRATEILFHSGTYNGHPLITAVGVETIKILEKEGDELFENTEILKAGIREQFKSKGINILTPGIGAMFNICITEQNNIKSYRDMKKCDMNLRRIIDYRLFKEGIYNKPCTRYHMSTAHSKEVVEKTIRIYSYIKDNLNY